MAFDRFSRFRRRSMPDPLFIIPSNAEKKKSRVAWTCLVGRIILSLGTTILLILFARFLQLQWMDTLEGYINVTEDPIKNDENLVEDVRVGDKEETTKKYWRGAVVEHSVISPVKCMKKICSRKEALSAMEPNILTYSSFIAEAAIAKVDLILFPEDGLTGFEFTSRAHILPLLQVVPDPHIVLDWVPCSRPRRFGHKSELLEIFSCLAKNNSIYVCINLGDWHEEGDKELAYNTDVVFDREGRLVARYHKRHLFRTEYAIYDRPDLEVVTFDTEFGKFGLMTCFDAMFAHPFLDLVEKEKIDSLLFLTAWWNSPPILTSLGYHSSLAATAGINYLAANRNFPPKNQTGSGIYTTEGVLASWTATRYPFSKMLVADIPVTPEKRVVDWREAAEELSPSVKVADEVWDEIQFFDVYNTTEVKGRGRYQVCQGTLCCIVYVSKLDNNFKLGVFQGLHTQGGQYRMEVCLLMKMENSSEEEDGREEDEDGIDDENEDGEVWMAGLFNTKYVYPQILLSGGTVGTMDIGKGGILKSDTSDFQTMVLLGRNYKSADKDQE